ncbi:MAG: ABC transporter permease subunit [Rhodobacterales bacterium]|nr:ABC transporter permease subunit [Rhodobacterales bacterium]
MWNPHQPLSKSTRYGLAGSSYLLVLLVWSAIAFFELASSNALPAPWEVAQGFMVLASYNEAKESYLLVDATIASVTRIGLATLLVTSIGIPVGILMGSSPKINAVVGPLLDPFRSAPIVSVLPILVIWMGIDEALKVAFLVLGSVVYLVPMTRDAIVAVPREAYISLKDLGATDLEAIRHGVLPMAMPRIWDAVTVAVSIMWTYITVAEYVNADSGLGQLITHAKRFSAMDQVFAGILVIILLALITNISLVAAKRALFPWETE